MTAQEAAVVLAEIAYHLRLRPQDTHRARAYSKAAALLYRDRPDLKQLHRQGGLTELEGVGQGIARTLTQLVEEGRSSYLERLRPAQPDSPVSHLDLGGYLGDLHVHSNWSDGRASVLEMALAAQALGYRYLCFTDHSPRITVVHGLDGARLLHQAAEIGAAQQQLDRLRLLQGIEVDILEDGSLDLPDEVLARLDLVIASPHVKLRMERPAMTERMLRAVQNPLVHIVGHPTGRRLGRRPAADYDYQEVFREAARHGTAMEIDCDPARMDLSPELARLAAESGCLLSLDSDAHAPGELAYLPLGAWMAERAGLDPSLLLNWLPLNRLRQVLARGRPPYPLADGT